ncbi:MAG: heme-binding protein [Paludibacter sp.]|nr:heme-binding protein [Paludibacter sp.]
MEFRNCIQELMQEIERILPIYMENPLDQVKTNGNVSICIIDEEGNVYGKMFGQEKVTRRSTYKLAWIKASQVWITKMKTGDYEKLIFNNEVDETVLGIDAPDLIGWPGGQPVKLKDGTILSIGFSGFRGEIDLEIVIKALTNLNYI